MLENHIELGVGKIQIYCEILQTTSPEPYIRLNQNLVRGIRVTWRLEIAKNLYIPKLKMATQGWHRLEKYLNLEGFLEKSLRIKSALKTTGKSLKGLEKFLNSSIFCRT